jgi:signal transduction histidine kinase
LCFFFVYSYTQESPTYFFFAVAFLPICLCPEILSPILKNRVWWNRTVDTNDLSLTACCVFCMKRVSTNIGIDTLNVEKVLDFLPYPFLLSEFREQSQRNIFVNKKFVEEIGYTCVEIPTINDWFKMAYPDASYRESIIEDWHRRSVKAECETEDYVVMQAKVQTKNHGEKWYEVKASIVGPVQFVAFINIDEEIKKEEELRRLNDNMNRTLSILSHDLRSPLNSLHAVLGLMSNGHLSETEQTDMLSSLGRQVFQMIDFLDNTLRWTKINFNRIKVANEPLDVSRLIVTVLDLYEALYVEKKIQIDLNIDNSLAVSGDPEIFSILIRNIISNAIKFTPLFGNVKIFNSICHGNYVLSVENSGKGISQDQISKILDKNYESRSGTIGEKGLGLGLKLCMQLLDVIGGKLEMESHGSGYTTVRIIFR